MKTEFQIFLCYMYRESPKLKLGRGVAFLLWPMGGNRCMWCDIADNLVILISGSTFSKKKKVFGKTLSESIPLWNDCVWCYIALLVTWICGCIQVFSPGTWCKAIRTNKGSKYSFFSLTGTNGTLWDQWAWESVILSLSASASCQTKLWLK